MRGITHSFPLSLMLPTLLGPLVFAGCSGNETPDTGRVEMDAGMVGQDTGPRADMGPMADAGGGQDAGPAGDMGAGPTDTGPNPDAGNPDMGQQNCTYPSGVVEPMALNEVINSYTWPAINPQGGSTNLSLESFFCNNDPDRDWDAFDYLLLASVPTW